MKKNIGIRKISTVILLLTVCVTVSAQSANTSSQDGLTHLQRTQKSVDSITVAFGKKLGTAGFASDREWTVEGFGITQIWSDAVKLVGCDTIFKGGTTIRIEDGTVLDFFYPDCRDNLHYPGSLFSWGAVERFGSELCPAPWRVPTQQDFCDLNRILFDGARCFTHTVTPAKMAEALARWGGVLAGACASVKGTLFFGDVKAYYWSQTEFDERYAYYFNIDVHGNVQPQCLSNSKMLGFNLRCVR